MKKIYYFSCIILLIFSIAILSACKPENKENSNTQLLQFTGIHFEDTTFIYDGEPHAISVTGDLPEGTQITYQNNMQTNAGVYDVTASLSKTGYHSLTLKATLTIQKAQFSTDILLESQRFMYDGKPHSLAIKGTLPTGTDISYQNNDQIQAGKYTVTATLTNPNYEEKTLSATLEIYTLSQAADKILSDILDHPEPWSFLPEAFAPEYMAYPEPPVNGTDFEKDTYVSSIGKRMIGKRMIGKQMNVLYDGLSAAESALKIANIIFTTGETIISVYQNFIDQNPNDYDSFTGTAVLGGFTFCLRIAIDGERVTLLAGNDTISVELISDRSPNAQYRNEGRIQITNGIALKYQSSNNSLKLAVQFTVNGVGILQQIEFIRTNETIIGYLYEFLGTEKTAIKTSALLYSDAEITAILSDKRESNDLKIDAYEEVYDSKTGEMLGGEVTETIGINDYDTLWFQLYDITGIRSVRLTDETNSSDPANPNTVYINEASAPFVPEFNSVLGIKTSRHYDIEFKTVWYYIAVNENGETTYEKREAKIPMLFVQKDNVDDFSKEAAANNENFSGATLPASITNLITDTFNQFSETYLTIKENVSFADIVEYIGSNDPFLENL